MKRIGFFLCVALAVGSIVAGLFGQAYYPTDYQISHGYVHIRPGGVSANDAPLTASTSSWHDVQGWVRIPQDWDSLSISFFAYGDGSGAGDPANGVFDATVVVVHEYGSAITVARISVTVGQLQLSHDPAYGPGSQYKVDETADTNHKWAEGPFTVNEDCWRSPVECTGEVDGIGELNFNHGGATHIKVLFDNKADITTVYAVMTGRKQ